MRFLILAILAGAALGIRAEDESSPAKSELPKDVEAQEHYVLLSVKLKNLAEIQDLMLKQQQLILQSLDALRKQLDGLEQDRTNLVTRAELDHYLSRLDQLQQQFDRDRETNSQAILKAIKELSSQTNSTKPSVVTNIPGIAKYEQYKVLPGDALSRIVLRWNETLDKRGLPRITQDQVERVNSGLAPDRIRPGQVILLPVPEPSSAETVPNP
jgi:LysM repeat protein